GCACRGGGLADELLPQMRNRNVAFGFSGAVESLGVSAGPPRRAVLNLESGKRIVADMVLFSAGRIAATGSLNLPAAGLTSDTRGRITVDAQFRTALPHVFAAGDVIGYPSLAATSAAQRPLAALAPFPVA